MCQAISGEAVAQLVEARGLVRTSGSSQVPVQIRPASDGGSPR